MLYLIAHIILKAPMSSFYEVFIGALFFTK